jgi:hypothetical protein
MKKRIIGLLMATVLMVSACLPGVIAKAASAQSTRNDVIVALKIMSTNASGSIKPNKKVTRGSFSKMLARASSFNQSYSKSKMTLYSDVKNTHKFSGYIKNAVDNNWMSGYLSGYFRPGKTISLREAIHGVCGLLGYTSGDFEGSVASGEWAIYKKNKLNKNISKKASQGLTRKDCVNLFYNLLTAETKNGQLYGAVLGCTYDEDGDVDDMALITSKIKGPIVATQGWKDKSAFSFTNSKTKYYRNGKISKSSAINVNDILYYSKALNRVWSYNERATGVFQSATPNRISPTGVTISGKTYQLETKAVKKAFSTSYGDINIGDTVTVMLGKDGSIAHVVTKDLEKSVVVGVVLESGERSSQLVDQAAIVTYIRMIDSLGNVHEYEFEDTKTTYNAKDVVQVSFVNGDPVATKLVLETINGIFNYTNKSYAGYRIASDVNILDLAGDVYMTIQPERLDGVTLNSASVLYYETNINNEISDLILNNCTGDLYQYGIMTSSSETTLSNDITSSGNYGGSYTMILDGEQKKLSSSGRTFGIGTITTTTPMGVALDTSGQILAMQTLTYKSVTAISSGSVRSGSTYYTLADNVVVYLKEKGLQNYYLTELNKIADVNSYLISAYYDKSEASGGRVRLIIAEPKN